MLLRQSNQRLHEPLWPRPWHIATSHHGGNCAHRDQSCPRHPTDRNSLDVPNHSHNRIGRPVPFDDHRQGLCAMGGRPRALHLDGEGCKHVRNILHFCARHTRSSSMTRSVLDQATPCRFLPHLQPSSGQGNILCHPLR